MSWLVRDAVAADAAACAGIYRPYVTGTAISFEESAPDAEAMAGRIAAKQERHAWLVAAPADDPTAVTGYAYAGPFGERAAYRWTAETSVYVALGAGHGGAGRALYDSLLTRLAGLGYRRAVAVVTVPNEPSIGFHRTLGFADAGRLRRAGWKHGSWHDVAWLQLDLDPDEQDPPTEPGP